MEFKENLERQVLMATRDVGIGTLIFRNSLAKGLDLTLSESLCLTYLQVQGQLSPSTLAKLIGLRTGSTTAMLDRLEEMGYIRRLPSPVDRRKLLIELTDRFQNEARTQVQGVQKAHRDLITSYSAEELAVIARFLKGFSENLAQNSDEVREFFSTLKGTP